MSKKKILGFIFVLSVIIIVVLSGYMLVTIGLHPKEYSGIFI